MATPDFRSVFAETLAQTGLERYLPAAPSFEILCDQLIAVNRQMNLTAITDPREIALRHFADSLSVADRIGEAKKILDVGCGGGFPTLPLAIVSPDRAFTALDSTAKKLIFVNRMAKMLRLPVKTLSGRAEELSVEPNDREQYDLVLSRAVARMNILAELCLPFVRVGGRFVALKGSDGINELAEASAGIERLGGRVSDVKSFTLADAGGRVIVEVEKVAPTPAGYPRPFGQIRKRPL